MCKLLWIEESVKYINVNKYYTNIALYTLLYIYSVSKCSYTVCTFGCVLHWMVFRLKVCRVCVCVCVCALFALCRSESLKSRVHYLAWHQSTSCYKSIQTSTATEETVHCICVSAAQEFFRPTQLYLNESYYKMNKSFFLVLFQILWIVT